MDEQKWLHLHIVYTTIQLAKNTIFGYPKIIRKFWLYLIYWKHMIAVDSTYRTMAGEISITLAGEVTEVTSVTEVTETKFIATNELNIEVAEVAEVIKAVETTEAKVAAIIEAVKSTEAVETIEATEVAKEVEVIEEWRTPEGFAPYQISNLGRLRSKNGLPMSGSLNNQGYRVSCLHLPGGQKMAYHHRLVALAFIPNPENKPHVNHCNGDRGNNRITNLEWVTVEENMRRKVFPTTGREMRNVWRQVEQLSMEGEVLCIWESQSAAAAHYNVSSANINACCIGRQRSAVGYRWRNVDKPTIESLEGEEWKELEYKKYKYKVSSKGRVILKTGGVTKGSERSGYLFCNQSHPVHRLVAIAFLPNPDSKEFVNHIDGNGLNNDVSNLEWATPKENSQHAVRTGLTKGEGGRKRPVEQYDLKGNLIATYASIAEAARVTKCNAANIGSVCVGRHYQTVGGFKWKYAELKPIELSPEDAPVANPNRSRLTVSETETKTPKPPTQITPAISHKTHGKRRPVAQYTLDGKLVARYPSLAEAERQTGFDNRGISANCNGTNKTSKGFVWKYDEDTRLAAIAPVPIGHQKIVAQIVVEETSVLEKHSSLPKQHVTIVNEQLESAVIPDDDIIWSVLGF